MLYRSFGGFAWKIVLFQIKCFVRLKYCIVFEFWKLLNINDILLLNINIKLYLHCCWSFVSWYFIFWDWLWSFWSMFLVSSFLKLERFFFEKLFDVSYWREGLGDKTDKNYGLKYRTRTGFVHSTFYEGSIQDPFLICYQNFIEFQNQIP